MRQTAFLANILNPVGADSLFTISNLVITSVFHENTQALAGGVFNTVSQVCIPFLEFRSSRTSVANRSTRSASPSA